MADDDAHPHPMAPVPTPPLPGSMTVPPLFGWETILAVLALLVAVAVVFFLVAAAGRGVDSRSEWQAWLDARSSEPQDLATEPPGPVTRDPA